MDEQGPHTDVNAAFNPELRQAQQDWELYLENRPYQDARGNVHDPAKGNFINSDQYFDQQRDTYQSETQTPYEKMSMSELARHLAAAEYSDDKTTATNVSDVLLAKMAEQEAKTASTREGRDADHNQQQSDNLWNRVMGIKDNELARLKETEQIPHKTIRYAAEEGHIDFVDEYDQTGTVVDWSKLPEANEEGREMLITLSDGSQILVKDKTLYRIPADRDAEKIEVTTHDDYDELANVPIGQPRHWNGGGDLVAATKVEVVRETYEEGADGIDQEHFDEERQGNPFEAADKLIEAYLLSQVTVATTQSPDQAAATTQGRASEPPRSVAQAYYGLGARAQMRRDQLSDYFKHPERGGRRRVAAAFLGIVALFGGAYGATKGVHALEHGSATHAHAAHTGNGHHHLSHQEVKRQHETILSLDHEGTTIEGQVANHLHLDVQDPGVTKVTGWVLDHQHLSWNDARHLPVGYHFGMPPEHILRELLKDSVNK